MSRPPEWWIRKHQAMLDADARAGSRPVDPLRGGSGGQARIEGPCSVVRRAALQKVMNAKLRAEMDALMIAMRYR